MPNLDELLIKAIKDYILGCDNKAETVSELKRYKKEFPYEPDYNYYRYGNILPYYSQMREFMESKGIKADKDDEAMCIAFCKATGKAIDLILKEEG